MLVARSNRTEALVERAKELVKLSMIEAAARDVTRALQLAPDDREAFLAGLLQLLEDPAALVERGRAGRRFVQSWASPAAVATAYSQLFESVVAR